jgi:hypothetical protein
MWAFIIAVMLIGLLAGCLLWAKLSLPRPCHTTSPQPQPTSVA